MKFAHMADIHIGTWREPELKELSILAFEQAIQECIDNYVGFILISGDLFHTALPQIDLLKKTAAILKQAKQHDISIYIIAGSHDFSPSGKTMLDVLEKAGLIENVTKIKDNKLKFTLDKTGVKITGLLGRKGGLEKNDYKVLDLKSLEKEEGFKIFMFHTALNEFKPKEFEKVEGQDLASLPKNFNYYAGGHIHYIFNKKVDKYGHITFPGALFPANFKELEEFKGGGFYIVNYLNNQLEIQRREIKIKEVLPIYIDANEKTPDQIEEELLNLKNFEDKILTIRISGTLESGKPSDINFKRIYQKLNRAYSILKNTNKLTTKEYEDLEIQQGTIEEIEEKIIQQTKEIVKIPFDKEEITKKLMDILATEKQEGEKNLDFETRIIKDVSKTLKLDLK